MLLNHITAYGNIKIGLNTNKDRAIISAQGAEVYSLTLKADGSSYLAAFDSPVAAKRFFAENKDYFYTKLF